MPTGLERPGGTSSGLPPALLTSEIEQKPTSRAPGAAGLLLFDFACSHEGATALLAVLVGAPESAPWTLNPSPPFGINHLGGCAWERAGGDADPVPGVDDRRGPDDVGQLGLFEVAGRLVVHLVRDMPLLE